MYTKSEPVFILDRFWWSLPSPNSGCRCKSIHVILLVDHTLSTNSQLIGSCDGGQAVNADVWLGIDLEDLLLTTLSCNTTLVVILKRIIPFTRIKWARFKLTEKKLYSPAPWKTVGGHSKLTLAKGGENTVNNDILGVLHIYGPCGCLSVIVRLWVMKLWVDAEWNRRSRSRLVIWLWNRISELIRKKFANNTYTFRLC